jgi:outer membrane lipoprotein-sorting protein
MFRKTSWVMAVLAIVGCGSGAAASAGPDAQSALTPAAGKTADQVIAEYVAARGGKAKMDAIQTVRFTGKISGGGMRGLPMTLEKKRPNLSRRTLHDPEGVSVTAFDGHTAWQQGGPGGGPKAQPLPADRALKVKRAGDLDGSLVDYKTKGYKVELLGKEKVGDSEAYRLRLKYAEGDETIFDIDVKSHLLIRSTSKTPTPDGPMLVNVSYNDYREAGGVLWPHTEVAAAASGFTQTFAWDKIETNVKLDDSLFRAPS